MMPKVRRSLKSQKNEKQNRLSHNPSTVIFQLKTTSASSLIAECRFEHQLRLLAEDREINREPLSNLFHLVQDMSNSSKAITSKQENVESNLIQYISNDTFFKKNTAQTRFSQNYSQDKVEEKQVDQLRPMKMDRAQSSGSFFIPKLNLNELSNKKGVQWRSQYVNVPLEKSASKLTHHLTDLNVKCTQSINDSESLRISEVVSDSEESPSDTHRTQTLPKRIKDLMHMKYSKMEGNKY